MAAEDVTTNCAFWIFAKVLDYTCVSDSIDFEKCASCTWKPALRVCGTSPRSGHRRTASFRRHDFSAILRSTRAARGFAVAGGTPRLLAMGSDVDAIWASLKAKTAPSQHAARAKALLRDARGDSSSRSTTRPDRRRDASGTRPSPVTGARGAEASRLTDDPERKEKASEASSRTSTRGARTERASSSRAPSDPERGVGSGETEDLRLDRRAEDSEDPRLATEDALRRLTARDLNVLADTESAPQTRVQALRRVREALERRVEPALVAATAAELFLKPFLRRLEDTSERCRETAADALAALVRGIAACPGEDERGAVLDLLPYAVPVLRERLGPADGDGDGDGDGDVYAESSSREPHDRRHVDPREPSEEIRVKLHRVFRELLVHASESSGNALAAYASDAVLVLGYTAEDAFWEVVLEACALLEALCDKLGRRLAPVSKKLAWTFAPNLTHRRSTVRVASLRALRGLMHCGAHETILDLCAFKHPNLVPIKAFYGEDRKVNYFGKLALDPSPNVRLAFVQTLRDWMTTLVERADHEPRLLPYVMSAAADEDESVRDAALELLNELGAQYEREHEKDLKATMTYAPEHFGVVSSLSDSASLEPRAVAYPPPFAARPGLGARVLVKNNFPSVVNPILAEMMGWQEEARTRASKLLRANLVFLEENATQHCQQLCLAFVKVCAATSRDKQTSVEFSKTSLEDVAGSGRSDSRSDSSASRAADVEPVVAQCCSLVGAFVKPDEWLEVLLERCGPGNEPATVAGALAVAAECCAGAAAEDMLREEKGTKCPCDRILDVLEHPSLVGSSDTAARAAACRFAATALSRRPRTWGGDKKGGAQKETRAKKRLARLLGATLRAGARPVETDEAAEPARACRAAFAAAARALGMDTEGTDAQSAVIARLRGELLAPLTALPRGAWRAHDAAALVAVCDSAAGGAFDDADASATIRLVALVAEAHFRETNANARTRVARDAPFSRKKGDSALLAALLRFPFLETRFLNRAPLRDEDVALVIQTTASALEMLVEDDDRDSRDSRALARTNDDAKKHRNRDDDAGDREDTRLRFSVVSSALDATVSVLRREMCSDDAARAAAGAVAARAISILETRDVDASVPARVRAKVCALVGTLAERVAGQKRPPNPSILAAPQVLARLVPALGKRLDDADAATRAAAAAALAALAAAAPWAAYHCVRAATAAHFVEEGARADARRAAAGILLAAYEAHPGAAAAAAARPEGSASAVAARAALAEEAGVDVSSVGAFDESDAALEGGLRLYVRSEPYARNDTRELEPELEYPGEATRFGTEDFGTEETPEEPKGSSLFGLD